MTRLLFFFSIKIPKIIFLMFTMILFICETIKDHRCNGKRWKFSFKFLNFMMDSAYVIHNCVKASLGRCYMNDMHILIYFKRMTCRNYYVDFYLHINSVIWHWLNANICLCVLRINNFIVRVTDGLWMGMSVDKIHYLVVNKADLKLCDNIGCFRLLLKPYIEGKINQY